MRCGLLVAMMCLVAAVPTQATTLHVPGQFSIIQDAIDAAQAGDTVLVAPGVFSDLHHPPGADTTRCVVSMKTGVTLRGSGQQQTVIDPQDQGRGIYCNGVTDGRIEALTIQHAFAEVHGAGLYCTQGSSPSVSDCEITACTDGGVIITFDSHPELSFCQVTGNEAKQGGGIAIEDNSSPHLVSCTITGNQAPAGGGVFVRAGSAPLLESCAINDNFLNTVSAAGGGIAVVSAQLTLRDSQVNGNTGTGSGGGIAIIDFATVVIEDTEIRDNTTTDDYGPGGGVYCELSDLTLTRCLITGNNAPGSAADGGGIYAFVFDRSLVVSQCTIAGNGTNATSGQAGGISCNNSSPVIEKTIIAFNGPGAGMYCDGASTPDVSCTDVFGNAGGDLLCGNDLGGNFSLDPRFCDLAGGDFTLHADSPCLDNQHPQGAACDQIGARGLGSCDGIGVADAGGPPRARLRLFAAPNPFGMSTIVHFDLGQSAWVWLAIYDVAGRRVRLLEAERLPAGSYERPWDARDDAGRLVPSGVYFYRLGGDVVPRIGRLVLSR